MWGAEVPQARLQGTHSLPGHVTAVLRAGSANAVPATVIPESQTLEVPTHRITGSAVFFSGFPRTRKGADPCPRPRPRAARERRSRSSVAPPRGGPAAGSCPLCRDVVGLPLFGARGGPGSTLKGILGSVREKKTSFFCVTFCSTTKLPGKRLFPPISSWGRALAGPVLGRAAHVLAHLSSLRHWACLATHSGQGRNSDPSEDWRAESSHLNDAGRPQSSCIQHGAGAE